MSLPRHLRLDSGHKVALMSSHSGSSKLTAMGDLHRGNGARQNFLFLQRRGCQAFTSAPLVKSQDVFGLSGPMFGGGGY